MPATKPVCPYLDKQCPKVAHTDDQVTLNAKRLAKVERLLYVIIGMLAIEYGFVLL